MIKQVDLHMHSCYSDGERTPVQLIELAKEKGIDAVSLTDHDCIEGLDEMSRAAKNAGIAFVSGVELSCYDKKDTHILGYKVDWHNDTFRNTLNSLQKSRIIRMEQMVERLIKGGFDITMDEVVAKSAGKVLGRPHVATVLVEKGYGTNTRDIFNKYISAGCPYYVPYQKLCVEEGIRLIHEAGGYAVLAHPKLLRYNTREFTTLICQYKKLGLDGIEAYYPCHYDENVRFFQKTAKDFDLFMTCGGDYHNDHDSTKNHMGFDAALLGLKNSLATLFGGEL